MKRFWMYMLRCANGLFYTGSTAELDRRVAEHCEGLDVFTRDLRPLRLVHAEEFPTREDAKRREHQVKRWSAAKKAALVAGDYARLSELARKR